MPESDFIRARGRWQEQALQLVPAADDRRGRNAALTRQYARLYLDRPALYKRMGVSAFSSHRVGVLLKLYDDAAVRGPFSRSVNLVSALFAYARGDRRPRGDVLRSNLDHLRAANNQVYDDTAWAHFAYMDRDGGLAAVETGLAGDTRHALLLQAFRALERGRNLLEQPDCRAEGEQLVWHANMLLMRHEQEVIIQPHFDQLESSIVWFLSWLTWMDFDLETVLPLPRGMTLRRLHSLRSELLRRSDFDLDFTWFNAFLWTHGLGLLLRTRRLPSLRRLDHRWFWVERRVMPLWREVERRDRSLADKLKHIAAAGPLIT